MHSALQVTLLDAYQRSQFTGPNSVRRRSCTLPPMPLPDAWGWFILTPSDIPTDGRLHDEAVGRLARFVLHNGEQC